MGFQQGYQSLLRLGASRRGFLRQQLFLETFSAESLTATPAARISDDLALLVIERHRVSIGFEEEVFADQGGRSAVAIAVEVDTDIFVDQHVNDIAVIGQ